MIYKIDEVLSNGFVVGKVKLIKKIKHINEKKDTKSEIEKFIKARDQALKTLSELKVKEPKLNEYLLVEELMISDPMLEKRVIKKIEENKSAEEAVKESMDFVIASLLNSDSIYLKQRADDVEDVTNILINNINDIRDNNDLDKYILVADEILPSYLVNNHENILGIITKRGGFTSHSAIIARIWDIPYVISNIEVNEKDLIILDTRNDKINTSPTEEDIKRYEEEMNSLQLFSKKAVKHKGFRFMANVATNMDIKRAMEYGFDEIGLYRTEFIFMNTTRPYNLVEHYEMYSSAVKLVKNKPICFRTFDVKEDKAISYLKVGKKSVETYKKNKDIFENQVKAILASNEKNNVKIMFPMIETKEDFQYLKNWVIKIQQENNYNLPKIGMMLETKKALKNIEDFKDVDFISIGTNDLTKELYNINRNEETEYNTYIEDLLKELRKVAIFAKKNNISLSVCGELASTKEIALRFYEIGINSLSVSPAAIKHLNYAYTEFVNTKRKLFVVGDSTLAKFNDVAYLYPRYGYAEFLKDYLNDKIEVINLALSGRSAKSYMLEDNYNKVFNEIRPKDFLLIGFGHNDQKDDDIIRFARADKDEFYQGSFTNILYNNYIKKALEKRATVIVSTPISRLAKDNVYKDLIVHDTPNGNYEKAILSLEDKYDLSIIDLTKPTMKLYKKLGYEQAIYHHAITKAKSEKNGLLIPEISSVDNTHLSYYGAKYVAYMFIKENIKKGSDLKFFVNKKITKPSPDDIKINPDFKFIKYTAPDLKKYNPTDNLKSEKEDYYGTIFGDGIIPANDDKIYAKFDSDKALVGSEKKYGKINASSTAIAFLFKKIPLNKNARAKAHIKVLKYSGIKQSGFGLMIRDDCYINQIDNHFLVSSNEIASGLITSDAQTNIFYSKENFSNIIKEPNIIKGFYNEGDEIYAEITRIGQRISLFLEYKNKTYKKDYYDYDLKVIDNKFYYMGLFAANNTLIESKEFEIEILEDAKEA